ncbi:MAG: hypothetical protein ABIH67_00140 [Candidatus Uhrbacteria bacterium]
MILADYQDREQVTTNLDLLYMNLFVIIVTKKALDSQMKPRAKSQRPRAGQGLSVQDLRPVTLPGDEQADAAPAVTRGIGVNAPAATIEAPDADAVAIANHFLTPGVAVLQDTLTVLQAVDQEPGLGYFKRLRADVGVWDQLLGLRYKNGGLDFTEFHQVCPLWVQW